MEILLKIEGIGIGIASAILTVLYPEKFTVIDYRVKNSLKHLKISFPSNSDKKMDDYLVYLEICKEKAKFYGLSLQILNQALWGMDFYEGQGGLKEIAAK